jgi:hypothetical protein
MNKTVRDELIGGALARTESWRFGVLAFVSVSETLTTVSAFALELLHAADSASTAAMRSVVAQCL